MLDKTQLVLQEEWVPQEYIYKNIWGKSEKKVKVRLRAKVKYGYDFKNLESMSDKFLKLGRGYLTLDMPKPSILSIEMDEKTLDIEKEDGVWNKVQEKDVEAATRECLSDLRKKLEQDKDLDQMHQEMKRRIKRLYLNEGVNPPDIEIRPLE